MSSKRDPADADKKPGGDGGEDLEDKPTELWAPVAQRLFGDVRDKASPLEVRERKLRLHPGAAVEPEPPRAAAAGPEEGETEEQDTLEQATDAHMDPPPGTSTGDDTAPRSAGAGPGAVSRLQVDTVEVVGEEADAALKLAREQEELRRSRRDPASTMVIDRPKNLPKLCHECRMCGRRIARPEPRRLRGSPSSELGFRCEQCHNVFCAAHVVRVSGLLESLFTGGRFRCQLCLPRR